MAASHPTHLTLLLHLESPKGEVVREIRVPHPSPWAKVDAFIRNRFGGRSTLLFRDGHSDWCIIEDSRSWKDAVRYAIHNNSGKNPFLEVCLRKKKTSSVHNTIRPNGMNFPLCPRTVLDRPDGPWPTIDAKKKLPPVLTENKDSMLDDWVDLSGEKAKTFKKTGVDPVVPESVSFTINEESYTIEDIDPAMTLAVFLREIVHLTGTKIGCGEGGCGACTVFVEYPDNRGSHVLNSCLRPVASLQGCKITTVEGLGSERKGLHEIQDRLSKANGSQCGYCSPGMVMAMYGMLKRTDGKPSLMDTEDAFQGNICRCTGYRPIVEAAHSFADEKRARSSCRNNSTCVANTIVETETKDAKAVAAPKKLGNPEGLSWYIPKDLSDASGIVSNLANNKIAYRLVVGNTAMGVTKYYGEHISDSPQAFVDIGALEELRATSKTSYSLTVGAAVTLAELEKALKDFNSQRSLAIARHVHIVANHQVRNAGSWAGNLDTARTHPDFPSDVLLLLIGSEAELEVLECDSKSEQKQLRTTRMSALDYFNLGPDYSKGLIIVSAKFPLDEATGFFDSHKIMGRHVNTHAYVNMANCLSVDKSGTIQKAFMVIGGVKLGPFVAPKTTAYLKSKPLNAETLQAAVQVLNSELQAEKKLRREESKQKAKGLSPGTSPQLEPPFQYRLSLALTCFYKSFLAAVVNYSPDGEKALPASVRSAYIHYERSPNKATQNFDSNPDLAPVNTPVMKIAAPAQCSGEAKYTGDMADPGPETLHAAPVMSTMARATITSIDASAAMKAPGVVSVITAKDIKAIGGSNNAGSFPGDEMIFAEDEVICYGQQVALVVATSQHLAEKAASMVVVNYGAPKAPAVLGIDDAIKKGSFLEQNEYASQQNAVVTRGDVDKAWSNCPLIVTGDVRNSGQQHFYMETQTSLVEPDEAKRLRIEVSSQGPTTVRKQVSVALNKPANLIRVSTRRAGGAFGGKLSRNIPLVTACAVAAESLGRPVRSQLNRRVDMSMTGGRHPGMARYKVGFDKQGKITALTVDIFSDAGCTHDDTFGILDMGQAMMDNTYFIPNYRATAAACKTNTISNTDMRAPGVCSDIYYMESVIDRVAFETNLPPYAVREANFYNKDQKTPFGDPLEFITLQEVWDSLKTSSDFVKRSAAVEAFNKANRWRKRGIYMTPIKYGMTQMGYKLACNVSVCAEDGTVMVAHSGVEIGQGINTKVAQAVAYTLQVPLSQIVIQHNSTETIPNSTLTGGSGTSECAVNAALDGAQKLLSRLQPYLSKAKSWAEAVESAWRSGENLTAQGYWGGKPAKGVQGYKNPLYDYFVYCAACSEVELDVLTGVVQIVRTDIVYDCGQSLNQAVDVGQIEGAFMQSLGFYMQEATGYSEKTGQVLSAGTWDYKVPMVFDIPQEFNVTFLKTKNPAVINTLGSKAVGEPPYQLGASIFFAAKQAVYAARKDAGMTGFVRLDTPASPVELQMACGVQPEQLTF